MPAWQQGTRPDLYTLAREVRALQQQLRAHEHEHETAERAREQGTRERERQRRTARRQWATTLVAVVGTNATTWLTILITHHG